MSKEEESDKRSVDEGCSQSNGDYQEKKDCPTFFLILVYGMIGFAFVRNYRRSAGRVCSQCSRPQSSQKNSRSFQSSCQEEAWTKYNRRLQEELEEELERVERTRRMQSVFNRERNKFRRGYESWQENGESAYNQHSQRNDWYWKADDSFRAYNGFRETPKANSRAPLSHHYSVLGLDRLRQEPYTDDEIKSAFRTKAKQFHPDQNQDKKEFAEAKFKEVMGSYEAIKSERKNKKSPISESFRQ